MASVLAYTSPIAIYSRLETVEDVQHYPNDIGEDYPESYALISSVASNTAVVFVHGFLGDAKGTWLQFQWMIDTYQRDHPWWRTSDLFFLSYASFSQSIENSANKFLTFVGEFFPQPPDRMLQGRANPLPATLQLPDVFLPERRYTKLILVGHSEGAVVLRRAMIIRRKQLAHSAPHLSQKADFELLRDEFHVLTARLALFAPAIRGFQPSGWMGALLTVGRIAAFVDPILHSSTAFVELNDKTLLNDLRDDTKDLLEETPWIPALKATSLFGDREWVVAKGEYLKDDVLRQEMGHTHTSICKPTPSYPRPLKFIAEGK